MRECGLKSFNQAASASLSLVTPLAGVWIEITGLRLSSSASPSLPLRECGLKYPRVLDDPPTLLRHSPCGSVD